MAHAVGGGGWSVEELLPRHEVHLGTPQGEEVVHEVVVGEEGNKLEVTNITIAGKAPLSEKDHINEEEPGNAKIGKDKVDNEDSNNNDGVVELGGGGVSPHERIFPPKEDWLIYVILYKHQLEFYRGKDLRKVLNP